MKQILAATCIFILTSNPAYGSDKRYKDKEMKTKQEKIHKSTQMDKKDYKKRKPASKDRKKASLTEKHYLIYE